MSGDLVIQMDLLDQLETDLAGIAAEYEKADDFSAELADVVGHVALGDQVREFSTSWNDRRKNMAEQVTALHGQVAAIRDAFTEVDLELSKALQEAAADTNAV
ncbi:MAG: hypothetical protein JWQ59_860 [Cryobacterium sp.]|jgi:prophage DNA circulation protein|nr:hypothetical protein [Cryobacterium sp.]